MPLNRPTQTDLLQAVVEYLRIPVTELGNQKADQFFRRVSANVLGIIQREIQLGSKFENRETQLLSTLLSDLDAYGDLDQGQNQNHELNLALCDAIDEDKIPITTDLVDTLKAISTEKLKIDNPTYF